jgi:hypothetical protein
MILNKKDLFFAERKYYLIKYIMQRGRKFYLRSRKCILQRGRNLY